MLRLPTLRPQYPYAITDQGFNLRDRVFNVTVGNFFRIKKLQQFVADSRCTAPSEVFTVPCQWADACRCPQTLCLRRWHGM